jgi:chaperonin GroEL
MQFDRGYLSPYFITDPERMEAVFEDVYLPVGEEDLQHEGPSARSRSDCEAAKALIIITEDLEGEALATLVVNKLRGTLQCAAVKAPGFGDRRKGDAQGHRRPHGGQVIAEELGLKLENVTLADLGRAKRVAIDKDNTTISRR